MSAEATETFSQAISGLCTELVQFLNKTESSLLIAKSNFQQVEDILKPWKITKTESDKPQCLCQSASNIESLIPETEEDVILLNNIKKTLNTAESMRQKESKTSSKIIKTLKKSSESAVKKKASSSIVKKCSSIPVTLHNPSCPFYKTSNELQSKSSFSLYESLSLYKIPNNLIQTIRHSSEILYKVEHSKQNSKNKYKDLFLKKLEDQNEKCCAYNIERDPSLEVFLAYLQALQTYENKHKKENSGWIFYNNKQNLKNLQVSKFNLQTEESWYPILKCILVELFSHLENYKLNYKEKICLYKILKTICKYANSSVPNVPIFKIRPNVTDNKGN